MYVCCCEGHDLWKRSNVSLTDTGRKNAICRWICKRDCRCLLDKHWEKMLYTHIYWKISILLQKKQINQIRGWLHYGKQRIHHLYTYQKGGSFAINLVSYIVGMLDLTRVLNSSHCSGRGWTIFSIRCNKSKVQLWPTIGFPLSRILHMTWVKPICKRFVVIA